MIYGTDLASIHHTEFGTFARDAAPGLLEVLGDAGIVRGLVVDLACGSGIWAAELIRAGYDVLGIDASSAMVDLARKTAPGGRFILGSVHSTPIPSCSAVTAIGEGISYLQEAEDTVDPVPLFARVYDALESGGLLIFDVVEKISGQTMQYRTTRSGADWEVVVEVSEDPDWSMLTRTIAISQGRGGQRRSTSEVHRVQTFGRAVLETMLRECGYTVQVLRSYGRAELPSRRLGVIARKR